MEMGNSIPGGFPGSPRARGIGPRNLQGVSFPVWQTSSEISSVTLIASGVFRKPETLNTWIYILYFPSVWASGSSSSRLPTNLLPRSYPAPVAAPALRQSTQSSAFAQPVGFSLPEAFTHSEAFSQPEEFIQPETIAQHI